VLDARRAAVLGLLQGPTELLPVSSSAHTILIPLLAGWPYERLDPALRKSFEVSLHAGSALALTLRARRRLSAALAGARPRDACALALACAPAAVAGLLFARPVEQRLSRPRSVALALAAGGLGLALCDRRPATRGLGDAGMLDALAVGGAQAVALVPGVSRSGAALAAARARRFSPGAAHALAWRSALPLMLGATLFSAWRAFRDPPPAAAAPMLLGGAGGAFCSALACSRLCRTPARAPALGLIALYRLALAALVLVRLRRGATMRVEHPSQ
jgi:undecaprenyl-diphosphatase